VVAMWSVQYAPEDISNCM